MEHQMQEAIGSQLRLFREKFGREPGPDDPVFFDPDSDTPQVCGPEAADRVEDRMIEAMSAAGIRPEVIYAFRKTGRIVTEDNWRLLSEADRKEWTDAVKEYFTRAGGAVQ
jgi:hypothetical protein